MGRIQQLNDMYMDSGLVHGSGSRWTCDACHGEGPSPLDIRHAQDCALRALMERASRSLAAENSIDGGKVAAIMARTPSAVRGRIESLVQDLALADTTSDRMRVVCRIKELCPHAGDDLLAFMALGGVQGDDMRRMLALTLMHMKARLEPLEELNARISELRSMERQYGDVVDRLLSMARP